VQKGQFRQYCFKLSLYQTAPSPESRSFVPEDTIRPFRNCHQSEAPLRRLPFFVSLRADRRLNAVNFTRNIVADAGGATRYACP
jgi:hypothetical protein